MNAFVNAAVDFLWAEGPMLLIGGTLLLAAGAMATCCQRSPAARQRTAELTVVGVLVWLILACVPLPRYDRSRWISSRETARPTEFKPTTVDGAVVKSASRGHAANDLDAVMAELPAELQEELSTGFPAKRGRRDAAIDDDPSAEEGAAAIATGGGRSAAMAPSAATGFEPVDWRQVGAIVYLLGAISSLVWLLMGRVILYRVLRVAEPAEPWLAMLFTQAVSGMAPCKAVTRTRLLVSRRCRRPFSCGLWRPTIVLPAGSCRPAQAERLRSVLLHELGHIERGDAWGHQMFHLGLPFWFFHPLYWYLRSAAQMSRELIADDCAARHSSPEAYVRQLIALARETGLGPAPAAVTAIFTSRTQFYRRMTMLIRRESPLATRCTLAWRGAALVSLVFVVGFAAWTLGVESIAAQTPQNNAAVPEGAADPAKLAPEVIGLPGGDSSIEPRNVIGKWEATDTVTVEIGNDSFVAVDEIQGNDLEAELVRLEKQIDALRRRLTKAQAAGAAPATTPKRFEALVEKVPSTTREKYTRLWNKRSGQPGSTNDVNSNAVPSTPGDDGAAGHDMIRENSKAGTALTTESDPIAATATAARQTALEVAVGGLHLDLVRLAEAYADAVGGVEIAKARLELAMAAANEANANAAARAEVKIQEVTVRTAERKFLSLRRIAEVVTGAAQEETKSREDDVIRLKQLFANGVVSESNVRGALRQYQAAQANLKTLRAILAD